MQQVCRTRWLTHSLFNTLPDFRPWFVQFLRQLAAVVYTVFKVLRHLDGVCRTCFYAKVAQGAKLQVVNECVQRLLLFSFRGNVKFSNDLDGAVGTGQLAGGATGAGVLVV